MTHETYGSQLTHVHITDWLDMSLLTSAEAITEHAEHAYTWGASLEALYKG